MKFEIKRTGKRLLRGFTLIELMVAMAVTSVIIVALIGITRVAVDAWKDSSDKTKAARVAKEMVDSIAKDLEGIVIRRGNSYEWVFARMVDEDPLGPDISSVELMNPLDLVFFTCATDRYAGEIGTDTDLGGDVSTVAYRIAYQDQFDSDFPVFSVYRRLINPDITFKDYLGKDDIQAVIDSDSQSTLEKSNYLVENVYDLTVSFLFEYTVVDNNGISITKVKRVPVTRDHVGTDGLTIKGNEIKVNGQPLTDDEGIDISKTARLAGADLSITVITDSGMNALNRRALNTDEDVAKFLKENTYHYSKSVILPRP